MRWRLQSVICLGILRSGLSWKQTFRRLRRSVLQNLMRREWNILKEQYLEAGRAEGEVIGADKLGRLMTALLSQNRIDDAKIASSDPEYREKLFKEFGIN